jgi:hypothetical protein
LTIILTTDVVIEKHLTKSKPKIKMTVALGTKTCVTYLDTLRRHNDLIVQYYYYHIRTNRGFKVTIRK